MKRTFVWILLLAALLFGSYSAGRLWKEKRDQEALSVRGDFDNGFRPTEFPLTQRSFVVVVSGFNNGATLEKTLRSIFSQSYESYRLIYIDDGSTDGSDDLARECIEESGQTMRTTFIRNETRLGQLASLTRAALLSQDQEILVVIHPEERLAHEWVLSSLNCYFADPDLWLVYAEMREVPSYCLGSPRPIKIEEWKTLRSAPLSFGLRAFYSALFRQIAEEDLAYASCSDLASMLPLLEMAQDHFQFIPETLTLLQQQRDNLDKDMKCERLIRSLKPYEPLSHLTLEEPVSSEGV